MGKQFFCAILSFAMLLALLGNAWAASAVLTADGIHQMYTGDLDSPSYFRDHYGAWASNGGSIDLTGNITTGGFQSYGAFADSGSRITMTGNITTGSEWASGAVARSNAIIDVNGNIVTNANYAYGVYVYDGATVTVANGITTYGGHADGVNAVGGATVTVSGGVTTSGFSAHGVDADDGSTVMVRGDITTTGASKGVHARNSSVVNVDGAISTSGNWVHAVDISSGSTATVGRGVTTNGDKSIGVMASYMSSVDVTGNISTNGADAHGAYTGSYFGDRSGYSSITISGDVTTSGDSSHGLFAEANGTISMSDGTLKVADNGTSWHMLVSGDSTINLARVTVSGDSRNLLTTGDFGAMNATGSLLSGNIQHDGTTTGTLAVSFDSTSLTGMVNAVSSDGRIDLVLTDSSWNVTGDSWTNGALAVGDSTVDYTKSALGTQVAVNSLSGNGTFVMKADIPAETADNLDIVGNLSGSHRITVDNRGSAEATGEERVKLVDAQDGTAGESTFTLAHEVEYGGFRYALRASDDDRGTYYPTGGQYWELYSTGSSNPGGGGIDTFLGNYYLAYAETDTLLKRLGELRSDRQYAKHGAWFRGFGGKMESDARNYASAFDMDYWGVQVGYDYLLDREKSWFKNGNSYVGAFIGYSKGDMDFEQLTYSNGDLEHRTIGMYWTYIADKGHYFDAVAKYVQGRNDFIVYDSAGDRVHGGKVNTGGVGLSLETGKRFRLGEEKKTAEGGQFYVEPQLQLSWQHFSGATFHASNGLRIGVDDFDSLIGRAGFVFGYESAKTSYYIKGFYLKEFQGDLNIHANDVGIYESLDDNWFVYGIGVTHQMNPRNALYLDVERSSGGDFEQKWNLNAGWRISF